MWNSNSDKFNILQFILDFSGLSCGLLLEPGGHFEDSNHCQILSQYQLKLDSNQGHRLVSTRENRNPATKTVLIQLSFYSDEKKNLF